MQNRNSLKNAFVWMAMFFVSVCVCGSFVSCQPDDVTGHDNKGNSSMSITVKPDTTKPGPKPVLRDSIYAYYRGDSLIIRYDSLKNDTIFKSDSTSIKFNANVKRNEDERQTTSARLEYPNMKFSFDAAQNKQTGRMEYYGTQSGSDEDGQEYTTTLNSDKTSFHGLNNVHFILKGTELVRFDNEKLTPKSTESVRVNSTMKWNLTVGVENVPGFDKELVVKANETSHERYILTNAPELIKRDDWNIWKETGNWSTIWHFECNEYWSNDSVAPKSKLATLKGTYSRKDLDDKTVSNLVDYTHPEGTLVWGDWYGVESKDAGVTLFEKKGTKKESATNGFDADKFNTEFTITMQKADVMFCDSLFHVESDEATLTNQRNVFVDEDSDRDGYRMVRFTDTEVAKWNGEYDVTLDETCKLYLKDAEPEIINEYWDTFNFETDAKEYVDRVEYFLKWIREYNTGKKTSTDVKVVLKRNAKGSNYTVTVEDPQREIGEVQENVPEYIARSESGSDVIINYDWKTSSFELPNYFDGSSIVKNDVATFVDPTNVKVTKKNANGEDVSIDLPSFEHQLTSTVSDLQKLSETEELVSYTYSRTWNWASNQCTSTVQSIGNINKIPEGGGGEPDFDIEVGKIFATVSRPSNRNGSPITAYTYLLVSKDGTKCLPIGIYKDVVTEGKIQNMHSTYNSACFVKDANEVVPTNCYSHSGLGMMIWADKNGDPVDAETHSWLQGNGFNDRGNDWINHTGKYLPTVVKKGKGIVEVQFSGTSKTYTFRGWDVK